MRSSGRAAVLGAGLVLAFLGCASSRGESRVESVRRLGVVPASGPARLELPRTADRAVTIASPGREVEVRFALRGVTPIEGRDESGVRVYPEAFRGADLVHVGIADGVEDLVFFDHAPDREELVYDLDVTSVAGLRQIGNALELLDHGGAPRLRVEEPWLVDRGGARVPLDLAVEGCAVDRDERMPWGRPVTAPGASSCRLRVAWHGARYPAIVDPVWRLAGSQVPARHQLTGAVFANGKVVGCSGHGSRPGLGGNSDSPNIDFWDPATSTWGLGSTIPVPRLEGTTAPLPSGKVLLVGGNAALSGPGGARPEIIGQDGTVVRSTALGDFGPGATAVALATGKVLVSGGRPIAGTTANAQLYTEGTDTWAPAGTGPAGAMKVPRAFHTATRLASGKVLITGGTDAADTPLASAEIYDPVADTFTLVGSMSIARRRHAAALLPDGKVLVVAGGGASAELFDPATNQFGAAAEPSMDRTNAKAIPLGSGDVMLAGGFNGAPLGTVEVYSATLHEWSTQAPLSFPRDVFAAVRLLDGSPFVFGGQAASGYSVASSEVWRPGAAGSACTKSQECLSGDCQEGVCCATACAPSCQTCAPGTGACVAVVKADDPSSCTGVNTCDAAGACRKKNGNACSTATDCASGQCVDGVCCDRACDGQCEACDVQGLAGTCVPVTAAPHGARTACVAAGTTCGGACNGVDGARCAYPSAATTCSATCSGFELAASSCDGKGACVADAPRPCAGNFVCEGPTSCKTTCATNADCVEGYSCTGGRCLPNALCEERYVTKGTEKIDCYPYTCEQTGRCRDACASVADCVAPTVCSLDGRCIDPPSPPASGCAASPRGAGREGGILLVLAAFVAARRRQRRAS